MKLRKKYTPTTLTLAFLLGVALGAFDSDVFNAVAWASESSESESDTPDAPDESGGGGGDDNGDENVEEVVSTAVRRRSDGHSTGGGTGHATPQLLGSGSYDYYASVECPLSQMGAAQMPGCTCPAGWVKKTANASFGEVTWCDESEETKIENCESVGGNWLDGWCHLPMDDHITGGCQCFINGEWHDRGETTYPHCMALQDEAFEQDIFSVCQWPASW